MACHHPAATLYDPASVASGNFAIESVQVLFPGRSQSGFGVFVGGRQLAEAGSSCIAFLIRRDASVRVEQKSVASTVELVPWTAGRAVRTPDSTGFANNVLRVAVDADSARFSVNGERAATTVRGALPIRRRVRIPCWSGPERAHHDTRSHATARAGSTTEKVDPGGGVQVIGRIVYKHNAP